MKIENLDSSAINARLSISLKQLHAALIASLLILGMVLLPWGVAYAATIPSSTEDSAVKWHPGHYYTLMSSGKNTPRYLAQVYNELKETPALRGVQIRYVWAELEPTEGVYDFASIDQRLAELAAQKKRLIILLQTKSFGTDWVLVPDYAKAEKYEGGVFAFSSFDSTEPKGDNIKLWNPEVHDRLVALVRALGQRYNSHPYFEGIGFTETAWGQPLTEISSEEKYNFYYNLLSINQQMRKYFPNTMTYQFTNFPRPILKSFVNNLIKMGAGLGGPDTRLEDPGLFFDAPNSPNGIYTYYPELSGLVPLTPSVMPTNYTEVLSDGSTPTVSELLNFARGKLKANYIFWTRAPDHYPKVLKVLNWRKQTSDPAGGLDATCPKSFVSCID